MAYEIEVTDTFGGEANYCWVNRKTVTPQCKDTDLAQRRALIKELRAMTGWTGRLSVENYGDSWTVRPSGLCQVAFISWIDADSAE